MQINSDLIVRDATVEDIFFIIDILRPYIESRQLLDKSQHDVIINISNYIVIELDGGIIGCGSFYIHYKGTAEIRSLALSKQYNGLGYSKLMMNYLVNKLESLKVKEIYCLTMIPEYFKKYGFEEIPFCKSPEVLNNDYAKCKNISGCCVNVMLKVVN
ncbi:MAG: GNAT family N-acetyltransferase [Cyanobacteriota bacterium]